MILLSAMDASIESRHGLLDEIVALVKSTWGSLVSLCLPPNIVIAAGAGGTHITY
jgi:hypothetical protein